MIRTLSQRIWEWPMKALFNQVISGCVWNRGHWKCRVTSCFQKLEIIHNSTIYTHTNTHTHTHTHIYIFIYINLSLSLSLYIYMYIGRRLSPSPPVTIPILAIFLHLHIGSEEVLLNFGVRFWFISNLLAGWK